jgi:hypothetical protein
MDEVVKVYRVDNRLTPYATNKFLSGGGSWLNPGVVIISQV